MVNRWTPEQDSYLIKNYPFCSIKESADFLSRSESSVACRARRLGLKNLVSFETIANNTKSMNIHYFDEWSPDMAYILGLLFADGFVDKNGHYFGIKLKAEDFYLLEIIKKKLNSVHKVVFDRARVSVIRSGLGKGIRINSGPSAQIRFSNHVLVKILKEKYYLSNRKSLCEIFPDVPKEYRADFIRGFFDGDGSVSVYTERKSGYKRLSLSLVGSLLTLKKLKNMMGNVVKGGSFYKDKNIYGVHFSTKDSLSLCRWMYSSGLFLKRKYDVYSKFCCLA